MGKIKVLHVAQAAGGVDRYLRVLLKYINKNEYENILVCSKDFHKNDYGGLLSDFIQVDMRREISVKNDLLSIIKVRKIIKKYNPDIVYAHSSKAGVIARVANIGSASKCIYNPHGWAFNMDTSNGKKKLYTIIEKICARLCKKIVCISNAEFKSALRYKICNQRKLQVIFNGIDIEKYNNRKASTLTKSKIGIPEDSFLIGMVGRVSKQKAPDIFAKAAKLIKEAIPNAYFIIVGSGDLEDSIRKYVSENDLEKCFKITGWVEDPMNYIQLFDEAMLLSRWEGFGLVLPEYMISRKPIIATNIDAIPDLIEDGYNGLLVSVDQPTEIYQKALLLYHDKNLCDKLVHNGESVVCTKFDAKRVAKEHEILFKQIINI